MTAGGTPFTDEHNHRFLSQAGKRQQLLPPFPLRQIMDELETVAEDAISRAPEIITATPGVPTDSTFHAEQLPPLNKGDCPNFPPFTVKVEGLDAFTTAREYHAAGSDDKREGRRLESR